MNDMLENELDFDDDPLNATGVSRKSLVIFFLIDTSGSMKGTKMGELNTAMEELVPEIRRIGEADTDVKVAVLTFSTGCAWMYPEPISVEEFEKLTGRKYGLFEEYKMEDAEYVIVCMNSTAGTAKYTADLLRDKGIKAGVLKIRVFRPFPAEEIAKALSKAKAVAVLDKEVESLKNLGIKHLHYQNLLQF